MGLRAARVKAKGASVQEGMLALGKVRKPVLASQGTEEEKAGTQNSWCSHD